MSKRRRNQQLRRRSNGGPASTRQLPWDVAITVAWMLCLMATACALLAAATAQVSRWVLAPNNETAAFFLVLMLSIASVTGLLTLTLTAVALKVRQTPPPRIVTVTAIVMGTVPLLMWSVVCGL